jgi:hypothetical protein
MTGSALRLIVLMSLQPAIPWRVALLHCPPPLHRLDTILHRPANFVNHHPAGAGEFSTGTMGNFQPELTRWGQHWWTMRHPMVGLVRWGQHWWTMRHPMVGLVRWGQHWWTMSHPMVGLVRWGQRWWTMRHPIGGLCAWTAPVDDAASDGWLVPWTTLVDHASEDRRCPHRAKIRRVGAAERGTRRFPDFQDHYSIRKCSAKDTTGTRVASFAPSSRKPNVYSPFTASRASYDQTISRTSGASFVGVLCRLSQWRRRRRRKAGMSRDPWVTATISIGRRSAR